MECVNYSTIGKWPRWDCLEPARIDGDGKRKLFYLIVGGNEVEQTGKGAIEEIYIYIL